MVAPTHSALIRDLEQNVATVSERVLNLQQEQARGHDRLESLTSKTVNDNVQLLSRVAVLEHQAAELKRQSEERDRKFWMIDMALGGSILTFVANLVVLVLRK